MSPLDELIGRLMAKLDEIPDSERELATTVLKDLGELHVRQLAGAPDLAAEIAHARAAAASLSAAAAQTIGGVIADWLLALSGELVGKVLPVGGA